jgi:hypothetical protein
MRSHAHAVLVGALAWLAVAACVAGAPAASDPAQVGLRAGDLPASLQRCPGSGAIAGFIDELGRRNPGARDEVQQFWREQRQAGGTDAAIDLFVAQPAACAARLGAGDGTSAASYVVRFRDEQSAAAAYRKGMLGFGTPNQDQQLEGLTQGAATGVGRSSWILQRKVGGRALYVACWQRGTMTVLFLGVDLDPLHARQAMSAVDGRVA